MSQDKPSKLEQFFGDTPALEAAARKAVHNAVRRHKLLGESIAIWRDGKVIVVPPEKIHLGANGTNGKDSVTIPPNE